MTELEKDSVENEAHGRLNSDVCAMECQGCADNTKVPQLGEGQQRISNARLQGIEKGGST